MTKKLNDGWYPDIPIHAFLKRNPRLAERLAYERCSCGEKLIGKKPFVHEKWVAMICEDCICGMVKEAMVCVPNSEQDLVNWQYRGFKQ